MTEVVQKQFESNGHVPKRMTHRHDAIAMWLLANPDRTKTECAERFGVSLSYLSTLTNSDMFQSMYRRMANEFFDKKIDSGFFDERVMPLRERLTNLAHRAVERAEEVIEKTNNPEVVIDIMDKTLTKLGYGVKQAAPTAVVNNLNVVSGLTAEELNAARERYRAMQRQMIEADEVPVGQVAAG